jgi:hypothetical protein
LHADLGIFNVKQLLTEYLFPRTEYHRDKVRFIVESNNKLFKKLIDRKAIKDDIEYLENIPAGINRLVNIKNLTTKMLSSRFLSGNSVNDVKDLIRYGKHPKENEIHLFTFHNVCLSNAKLFKLKIGETELCPVCLNVQTTQHIFFECTNAETCWLLLKDEFGYEFSEYEFKYGAMDKIRNEMLLCCKRLLYQNRNNKLDKNYILYSLNDRLKDIESLNIKALTNSDFKYTKKDILSVNATHKVLFLC